MVADTRFLFSQIEMWYLHGPDRTTPYEDTLRAVNELYKEGKFKRFGISNYMSYVVRLLLPNIHQSDRYVGIDVGTGGK